MTARTETLPASLVVQQTLAVQYITPTPVEIGLHLVLCMPSATVLYALVPIQCTAIQALCTNTQMHRCVLYVIKETISHFFSEQYSEQGGRSRNSPEAHWSTGEDQRHHYHGPPDLQRP